MKRFYDARSLRERLLLLAFLLIGVVWWGSDLVVRTRLLVAAWNSAKGDAEVQRLWLEQEPAVAARTAQVAGRLDAARTLNATQAFATVSQLTAGLPVELGAQRTDRTDNFSLHSLQVTFRRADMAGLLRFYEGISARAPYLGIDQCTISADRSTPGLVNAVFRVYALEAAQPAP
jgi:hypothetical protein